MSLFWSQEVKLPLKKLILSVLHIFECRYVRFCLTYSFCLFLIAPNDPFLYFRIIVYVHLCFTLYMFLALYPVG